MPAQRREAIGDVQVYCMFIVIPAAVTVSTAPSNAHPEMVIAHELDALSYVERGISRDQLYSLILRRHRWFLQTKGISTGRIQLPGSQPIARIVSTTESHWRQERRRVNGEAPTVS